ncbi:nitroreductase family protein [Clostridium saudiense]|nr:nitroreductase family protein [Clostridium saudiense]
MIDLLKARRSIRRYKDRDIEKEKIESILKAGLLAPSSKGRKPWEFLVIKDKEKLQKLSKSKPMGSFWLANAPVGIVVMVNKEITTDVWIEDAAIAATLMQLEAHSLGLGSCWSQVRCRNYDDSLDSEEYVRNLLNIPENYGVCCILSIGYPDESRPAYEEKDIDFNKVHYEQLR